MSSSAIEDVIARVCAVYRRWDRKTSIETMRRDWEALHARPAAAPAERVSANGVAAAWIGGDVVFRQGWRVRPAEWDEQLEAELRKEGDAELIRKVHETVRAYERDHTLLP
jgi:hypothetical protein